jgi:Spy/CpxP family protein refolding chaperone
MTKSLTTRAFTLARPWHTVAAGLLIAASALAAQVAMARPLGGHGDHGAMMGGMGGAFGMGMGARMLDSVNATAEQRARIRDIMQAARDDLAKLRQADTGLRDQAIDLFAQPNIDARAAESLRQQMQSRREQAGKRMLQAMLDAAAVLTPEQRKQLAERAKQRRTMMERHRAERNAMEQPGR